ncbi:hypothetical protein BS78_06G273300 [Paspalum vaginatum]|nr:hypothetical protein BS78_06G273300 [Paspalum vaginatum]
MAAAPCSWLLALTTLLMLLMAATASAADRPDPLIRMPTMDDDDIVAAPPRPTKLTRFHFYFHEVRAGAPNATSVVVASLHNSASSFGDLSVFDNALRVGPDPSSTLIGRARGLGVHASVDETGALTAIEFVFSNYGKYTGSTMAMIGHLVLPDGAERSIVGGTGALRFARGYMTTDVILFNATYLVADINIYFTTAL